MRFKSKLPYPIVGTASGLYHKNRALSECWTVELLLFTLLSEGQGMCNMTKKESDAIIGRENIIYIWGWGQGGLWVVLLVDMKSKRNILKGVRLSCTDVN